MMRLISLNVGLPREVTWRGRPVYTAIFKSPVTYTLPLRGYNFEGDAQADLTVHGGPDKAVYAYPSEHYADWRARLGRELDFGMFGENLTTEGLTEDSVHIGDEFRIGTARIVVTQPRLPCFKLGLRFDDPGMVRTFTKVERPGIYFAVLEEGTVTPGDLIERVSEDGHHVSVVEVFRMVLDLHVGEDALQRALRPKHLAEVLRLELQSRLDSFDRERS